MKITKEEIKERADILVKHVDDMDFLKSPEFSCWIGLISGIEECALNILEGKARYFCFISLIKWVEILKDKHLHYVSKNIEFWKNTIPHPTKKVDENFYEFLTCFRSFFCNTIDSISEVLDKMHCLDKEFIRFSNVVVMTSSRLDFLCESLNFKIEENK